LKAKFLGSFQIFAPSKIDNPPTSYPVPSHGEAIFRGLLPWMGLNLIWCINLRFAKYF